MKTLRPTMLAAALAVACATATANGPVKDNKGADCKSIASIVVNTPFQLTTKSTTKISDCVSSSTYSGTGTVTVNGCNNGVVQTIPVRLDLKTTTTLNECGAGFTEGTFSLTSTTAGRSITGTLWAVNRNFGELQGTLDGDLRYKLDEFVGKPMGMNPHVNLRLRAVFSSMFVQDQSGQYSIIDVSDAHGVLYSPNKDASGQNGQHGQHG